ncbi:putative bzip family transcription factor protein [Daldinia childiae]|uniref:putative bzip family transcription factor protein n=1 Tax=Daldinia childiae TaxID=326645 RepID=UPI00144893DD|nr:putative bzip family transcription factor protein [Daldinia childiae]KAF3068300.1 putative bzip family transcription factor protein [Daldinia childiae]
MRYLHPNVAVLNAEQYDGGRHPKRPSSKVNRKPNTTVVPTDNAPNPRKRGRKSADRELDGPAEETKRSRGRPRLETKDQTPGERRRTQIRLAQRAYRNRKENAITDLQAKIDDLKSVNSEINNAYQDLFNYASQRGLLAQAPEFSQQLQKLQTLIKQTQEQDNSQVNEHNSPEGHSDDDQRDVQNPEDLVTDEEPVSTLPNDQTPALLSGIAVSHEPVAQPELDATFGLDPVSNNAHAHNYEVITAPTFENASFGLNVPINTGFLDPVHSSWASHPWNRLTGPHTMSFNEWSFARRLHRHTVERAAALISMPNPPPAKLTRVFGFVMLFETVDEIRSRTVATLDSNKDEPLSYWKYPFHRLGGSGTHFPDQAGPSSLSGSSTYQSPGFGTGPFNERTTRVNDTLLGPSQYINMSGWEGTWFDSDEVETYLAQNGVIIPTAADIHTVEIHPGAFSDVQLHSHPQHMQDIHPNAMNIPHIDASFTLGPPATISSTIGDPSLSTGSGITTASTAPPLVPTNSWQPIPASSNFYGGAQHTEQLTPPFTAFDDVTANTFVNPSYYFPNHEIELPAPAITSRRVVLDVNQFISGLIGSATCLGRAPSFRPKDIVSSFWNAVIG